MSSPTIQVRREQPVTDSSKAAVLLEAFVAAVSRVIPIETVLWDYADSAEGVLGFDLTRAMTRAHSLTGLGATLGWILMAGNADRSIEMGMTLLASMPRRGSAGVFFLKLPSSFYEVERLVEWCAVLLDSIEGERAIVWDDDGTILETAAASTAAEGQTVMSHRRYTFIVRRGPNAWGPDL